MALDFVKQCKSNCRTLRICRYASSDFLPKCVFIVFCTFVLCISWQQVSVFSVYRSKVWHIGLLRLSSLEFRWVSYSLRMLRTWVSSHFSIPYILFKFWSRVCFFELRIFVIAISVLTFLLNLCQFNVCVVYRGSKSHRRQGFLLVMLIIRHF